MLSNAERKTIKSNRAYNYNVHKAEEADCIVRRVQEGWIVESPVTATHTFSTLKDLLIYLNATELIWAFEDPRSL